MSRGKKLKTVNLVMLKHPCADDLRHSKSSGVLCDFTRCAGSSQFLMQRLIISRDAGLRVGGLPALHSFGECVFGHF